MVAWGTAGNGGERVVDFRQAGLGSNRTRGPSESVRARGDSYGPCALAVGRNEWLWPGFNEQQSLGVGFAEVRDHSDKDLLVRPLLV